MKRHREQYIDYLVEEYHPEDRFDAEHIESFPTLRKARQWLTKHRKPQEPGFVRRIMKRTILLEER